MAGSAEVSVAVTPALELTGPVPAAVVGVASTMTARLPVPAAPTDTGRVLLQVQRRSGTWATLASAPVAADGTAALAWTPDAAGRVVLRAVRPVDAVYAKAESREVEVTVATTPGPATTPTRRRPTPAPRRRPEPGDHRRGRRAGSAGDRQPGRRCLLTPQ